MDIATLLGVLVIGALIYYEKRRQEWPYEGHGLTGVAQYYFSRISYITQCLEVEKRKTILKKAYYTIKEYQKSYNLQKNDDFLQILFDDKYKDSERICCFALSFVLCDHLRSYGNDKLSRDMAVAYYDKLEQQLGELYDYCYTNDIYFPGEIVDCFCSHGYEILKKNSKFFIESE